MKTSDGFVKTTIAGIPYLLPYGQKIADHARSLRLNDSGALLWDTPVSYTHLDVYKRQLLS